MHVHQESYNQVLTKDWTCTSLSLVFYLCPTHWICRVYYMFWRLLWQCCIQRSPWQNKQTNSLPLDRYRDYSFPNGHPHIRRRWYHYWATHCENWTPHSSPIMKYPRKIISKLRITQIILRKCLFLSILDESITNTLIQKSKHQR